MKNHKIYEPLNVSAWAMIIIAFIIFIIGVFSKIINNAFVDDGIKTKAVITGKKEKSVIRSFDKDYFFELRYDTRHGSIDNYLAVDKEKYSLLEPGDEIEIYYLSKKPETIRLSSNIEHFSTDFSDKLSLTIFILSLFILFLLRNKRQKPDLSKEKKKIKRIDNRPHDAG
jgi:hypothetical protein